MSYLIHAYKGRTRDYTLTIYDSNTTEQTLAAQDVVRIKIGTNGETPPLDLSSIEDTEHGSGIDFDVGTGDCTLRLGGGDLTNLGVGAWDMEVNVVDESEEAPPNAIKMAEYGVLFVHPSQGGETAGEESSASQESSSSASSSSLSSSS